MASPAQPSGPTRDTVTDRAPRNDRRPEELRGEHTPTQQDYVRNPATWDSDTSSSSEDESPSGDEKRRARSMPSWTRREQQPTSEDAYSRFSLGNEQYQSHGRVSKEDGRLKIHFSDNSAKGQLAKTLEATLKRHRRSSNTRQSAISGDGEDEAALRPEPAYGSTASAVDTSLSVSANAYDPGPIPKLCICIMVIGSRGDIQPFIRIGKVLAENHGHRVRIATHPAFKESVEKESQLEFFSVGGDPAELMAFMVKNPGLVPKAKTIRDGEIAKRRESMYDMFQGFWRACIDATDGEHDNANLEVMGKQEPFIADAIIANPPSFAHIHCAERLGVPLHLMFTFPASPTQQFPHPLANIKYSNADPNHANLLSYPLVEMMTWQGLGDLVNRFRVDCLDLDPISTLWAPGQLHRMKVPYSYLWSPGLVPKPPDWGPEIEVNGFVFLNLAESFEPPKELLDFLGAGDPPIYIGFGSIVVDDPQSFTQLIFDAVAKAGVRALISQGWGGLGDDADTPDHVFMLGNIPHDWLFSRVRAVVHHGGAGSAAIALKCGCPTMIVPFFGDQPFWGAMVAQSGAGAAPIPFKRLTADKLADSIKKLLTSDCQAGAKEMADTILADGDGAENAVASFHQKLPLRGNHSMRCSILEEQVAVWWLKGNYVRLSALAAEILVEAGELQWSQLRLLRHYDWNDFEGPGEPVTGAGGAIIGSAAKMLRGIGGTPHRWATAVSKSNEGVDQQASDQEQDASANVSRERAAGQKSKRLVSKAKPKLRRDHKSGTTGKPAPATASPSEDELKREPSHTQATGDKRPAPVADRTQGFNKVSLAEGLAAAAEIHKLDVATAVAAGTKQGAAKAGKALASAPIDVSVAVAQGLHNAPRLWGDETVRTPRRVTGFKSGLRAARDEFAFGIYDGWTGLVQQPRAGARQEGALGLAKGAARGVGGFVVKDLAALAGAPAHAARGIQKQLTRSTGATGAIRHAHVAKGRAALAALQGQRREGTAEAARRGWRLVADAMRARDAGQRSGLRGKLAIHRGKRAWKRNAVFESAAHVGRAMQAHRQGTSLEREFGAHRRQVGRAQAVQAPRSGQSHGGRGQGAAAAEVEGGRGARTERPRRPGDEGAAGELGSAGAHERASVGGGTPRSDVPGGRRE